MSGLEILGAVAGAVQLADTCLKITTFAADLFCRIRDAPKTIQKRLEEVKQLIEIARLIEHNSSLQTPEVASVLAGARANADLLFEILKKLDSQPTAGKVAKYWKAIEGVTKEKKILAICDCLRENKILLTLLIANINSKYLRELNLELVTVRQGVDGIVKDLAAIRDMAGKVTMIQDELSIISAAASTLHNELPMISGRITTIHEDMPVLADKVTVIHDELPAIRDALERLVLSKQTLVEPIPTISERVPFVIPFVRDQDFVGREDIINKIDRVFSDRRGFRRLALAGLGGIGKTQIAIEYAYRLRENSPNTSLFWVHASNASRIEQSYRAIATAAGLPGADDAKTDILDLVLRWLQNGTNSPWLMILDNADDTAVFLPQALANMPSTIDHTDPSTPMLLYLPRTGGSILITSRNSELATQLTGKPECVLKIDKLDDDDALRLLQNKVSEDQSPKSDRVALIDVLDRLPLAITQAAAYIAMRRPRMSVSKYLEYFRRDEIKQIALLSMDEGDLRRDPEVPNAVLKTWQISFDQIKRQNTLAATILGRMSVFDRQGIPSFLMNQDEDDFEFDEAVDVLIGFSFIRSQNDGENFVMHPLVHLSTRKWLELHAEVDQTKEAALSLLSETLPTGDYENWTTCELLEPHVQHILRYSYVSQACKLERAKILHNNAWFAQARGNYNIAERMFQEAASTRENILGLEDPATLSSQVCLASTYWNQGRWKEAEELEVQVMEMSKRVLGKEHPETLTSMANLASTYWDQGRWKEAEELEVEVMETRKRVLGKHPQTLTSMANLASTYWNQGQWKKAEELEVQVMEMRKRVLGQEHPHTLASMSNLASTYRDQGRWKEAEELQAKELNICSRVQGKEHPETLTSMENLASTYRNQGRWKEADELGVQVMEMRKRVLGQEHPDTLSSMSNLASTYRDQGRWKKAEELGVQVMEMRKRVLGQEHPHTLSSMSNLASTYRDQGRWKEAEELQAKELNICSRVQGKEHPETLTSMENLASTYRDQGRWKEAEELGVQVMEMRKRVLGQEHPNTLSSMNNLASTYRDQGRWKEAEDLQAKELDICSRILGHEHPETLRSMANLASTYRNQGQWKEAEELQAKELDICSRILGQEHPETLRSMANLASTYQNQGRWKEAEDFQAKDLDICSRVQGKEHPETLTSMANLASTYRNQGQWKKAEELEVQVMEMRKRVLGQEHPHTLSSINNLALTYRDQGRWKEAEDLQAKELDICSRVKGKEHPETLTSMANLASMHWDQGRWNKAEELEVQVMETRKRLLGQEHPETLISMNNLAWTWKSQGRDIEAVELMSECHRLRKQKIGANHPHTISSFETLEEWQTKTPEADLQNKSAREGMLPVECPNVGKSVPEKFLSGPMLVRQTDVLGEFIPRYHRFKPRADKN